MLLPILAFHSNAHPDQMRFDPHVSASLTCPQTAAIAILPFDTTQITSKANVSNPQYGSPCHPLAAGAHAPAVCMQVQAVALRGRDGGATAELGDDVAGCLRASVGGGDKAHALIGMAVRRLMPLECERLQGVPDDFTRIPLLNKNGKKTGKYAKDGPRYKSLGNSMAVPCMAFIGRRIQAVADILKSREAA